MNLEILRLKYRAIYEFLSRRWQQILIEDRGVLKLYEGGTNAKEPMAYREIPLYNINDLLKTIGYTGLEINNIIRVLKFLFPPTGYLSEYGAINLKASIARYFYNTIQDRDLPIDVFKGLWQNNYEDIKEEVDNIVAKNQVFSFVNQLDRFIPYSVEVCKKAICIMFYIGSSKSSFKSSYRAILNKINLLNNYYSNEDEEIKAFLLSVVKENDLSDYMSDFLFSEYLSLEQFLSYEEIKAIETDYLEKAIQRDLSFNKIYDYMIRATCKGDDYEDNVRAKYIFKKFVERHVEKFLLSMVGDVENCEDYYYVSPFAFNVWGSWMGFQDYVKSISPRTPIIDEFESFLDKFIEQGAENSLHYKFKYIKVKGYIM